MSFKKYYKIDSLRLSIEIDDSIKIIEPELRNNILHSLTDTLTGETWELLPKDSPKWFKKILNGAKIHFVVRKYNRKGVSGHSSEYLDILLNSKILGINYLWGINRNNCADVWKIVNDMGVVFIPYDKFKTSYVSDIDICKDFILNDSAYKDLLNFLIDNYIAKPNRAANVGWFDFKDENGKINGIELNKRDKVKNPSNNPYFKIYDKDKEMNGKKNEFGAYYRFDLNKSKDLENLKRWEITVRSDQIKSVLKKDVKTFEELLKLQDDDCHHLFSNHLRKNYPNLVSEIKKIRRNEGELTGMNLELATLVGMLENVHGSFYFAHIERAYDNVFSYLGEDEQKRKSLSQAKSRAKKRLRDIVSHKQMDSIVENTKGYDKKAFDLLNSFISDTYKPLYDE